LNNDGRLDFVLGNFSDASVTVLLGDGTGQAVLQGTYSVDPFPQQVAINDFNNDGNLDLATLNQQSVSILLNDGPGSFRPAFTIPVFRPVLLASADLNGDGSPDLLTSGNSTLLSVLWNNCAATAFPSAPSNLAATLENGHWVLNWRDNSSDETGFEIERSNDGIHFSRIGTSEPNATLFVDLSSTLDSNYSYRVRATNGIGASPFSNTTVATPPASAGPAIMALSLSPTHVASPATVAGTLILDQVAPPGGLQVSLSSSHPNLAPVPTTVTIPEGLTQTTFFFMAGNSEGKIVAATLSASQAAVTRTAKLAFAPLTSALASFFVPIVLSSAGQNGSLPLN
jgi:FG-GAP-like repeat